MFMNPKMTKMNGAKDTTKCKKHGGKTGTKSLLQNVDEMSQSAGSQTVPLVQYIPITVQTKQSVHWYSCFSQGETGYSMLSWGLNSTQQSTDVTYLYKVHCTPLSCTVFLIFTDYKIIFSHQIGTVQSI